jgi:nucleoside-diphosphate-sugar epimerase
MICEDKEPVALVLGGAGFIGKALCKALAVNYKVICVDNLVYGQYAPQGISFVHVDLSKSEEVQLPKIKQKDLLYHTLIPEQFKPD